jgi:hypothetical protein
MTFLRIARRAAAVTLATAATAGALAGSARADELTLPDFCASGAPHATLNLGDPTPTYQAASSFTGSYYFWPLHLCRRFMVDTTVPPNKSVTLKATYDGPPGGPTIGGVPLSSTQCGKYVQYQSIYGKGVFASAFTMLAAGSSKGVWIADPYLGGHCVLAPLSGDLDFAGAGEVRTSGALGTTTFRVAVAGRIDDNWQAVRVTAHY